MRDLLGRVRQLLHRRGDLRDRRRLLHRARRVLFGRGQHLRRGAGDLNRCLLQILKQLAKLAGHVVGRIGQHAELVVALDGNAVREIAGGHRLEERHQRHDGTRELRRPVERPGGRERGEHDRQHDDRPQQTAERRKRHVGAHQQDRAPGVGQVRPPLGRRVAREIRRVAHVELAAAGRSRRRSCAIASRPSALRRVLPGSQPVETAARRESRPASSASTRYPRSSCPSGSTRTPAGSTTIFGQSSTATITPTGFDRSKLACSGNASGMPTRPVRSCIIGEPTHAFAAPRRLQQLAIADFAAAQRRQRRRDDGAGGVCHPELLRDVGVALGFLKELQNAAVGVARHRVVADEPELRPHREVLMLIEQQPLELFVALHRERFEVEADALFERAARDLVREDADHRDRQQRQRDRHERQLPPDVQFQRHHSERRRHHLTARRRPSRRRQPAARTRSRPARWPRIAAPRAPIAASTAASSPCVIDCCTQYSAISRTDRFEHLLREHLPDIAACCPNRPAPSARRAATCATAS